MIKEFKGQDKKKLIHEQSPSRLDKQCWKPF